MEKVLALDLALTTGYSVMTGIVNSSTLPKVLKYGIVQAPDLDNSLRYPLNNLVRVGILANDIAKIIHAEKSDVILIEALNRGLNRHSQTLLAFIHHAVLTLIQDTEYIHKVRFVDTSAWRKAVGLTLSKEQRVENKKLSKIKSQNRKNRGNIKDLNKLKKASGLKGKITNKHLAIFLCKDIFGIDLGRTEDDIADSIAQGLSFFKGVKFNEGK